MRFTGIVIAAALAGCVETASVACGDGTFCPEGTICVHATETVTVCAAPDRGECLQLADGDPCGNAGRCYDRVCLPIACGDRLLDPTGEMCDDGNVVGGDGCAADCRSDEQCRTGVLDPSEGEACDDGNELSHDGCSFGCTFETAAWRAHTWWAEEREDPSLVFDPVRGRITMFGGRVGVLETADWDGLGWVIRQTQFNPGPRTGQASAYDIKRRNLVLFGGNSSASPTEHSEGTWSLDAAGWTLVGGASDPERRFLHAMAYDPIRERVVLFGGRFKDVVLDETWEWDGTSWAVSSPTTHPPARYGAAMAFDPGRGTVLLYGGEAADGSYLDDTWEWNGATWTPIVVVPRPPARFRPAMTTYRGGVLLYGGGLGVDDIDDAVWQWRGSTWTYVGPGAAGPRMGAGMVTDFLRDRVVLFGGAPGSADVWEFDGTAFRIARAFDAPPTQDAGVAYDARRGRAVIVAQGLTFERIDDSWALVDGTQPSSRWEHSLEYDVARDEVVMFGGFVASGPTAETWALVAVGASREWVQRMPALSPPARVSAGLAHDAARSRTVLFGGGGSNGTFDDTWEWDGSTWQAVPAATRPSQRQDHAMAYDPLRRVTVLFGGRNGNVLYADTWEWNGTTWILIEPQGARPLPRTDATLTWNPSRRRLTLIGGASGMLGSLDDAWEWDGTSWLPVPTELRPPPVEKHLTMPASDGSGLVRFGGSGRFGPNADVWRLRWASATVDEQCGGRIDRDGDGAAGCDDPDCWARCTPLCMPGLPCTATAPRCGDGSADPRETCQLCPQDVGACPACGDLLCEPPETITTCPGDCTPPP